MHLFQLFLENSPEAFVVNEIAPTGSPGAILLANRAACDLLGYTAAELMDLSPLEILDPGIPQPFFFPEKSDRRIRKILVRKDGSKLATDITTSIRNIDGRFMAFSVIRPVLDTPDDLASISRDEYRLLFAANPNPMCVFDQDTLQFLAVNDAMVKEYGWTREEFTRMSLAEIRPEEDRPHLKRAVDANRDTREVFVGIWRHLRKNGTVMLMEITASSIRFAGRRGRLCVMKDVTERVWAEEALRRSENRYRMLHENMRDAFAQITMDGAIVEFNQAFCDMLGYSRAEVLAMTYRDLTPERWHAFEEEILREQVLRRGFSDLYEKEYRRRDGTIIPVELQTVLVTDEKGEPRGMWATVRDISRRKQFERALRESEERYRRVVQDQTEAISRFSADGTFLFVNDVYCRIFGKTAGELIGKSWRPVVFPEDIPAIEVQLRAMSASNPVVVIENRVYNAAGEVRWMQFVNRGFFDEQGRLLEAQSVGRDITERKMVEESLRESEERFRKIFEEGSLGAAIVGLDDRFLKVNQRYCDMLGYTEEEMLSLTVSDITMAEDVANVLREVEQVRKGTRPFLSLESRCLRKGGGVVWVSVTAWIMRDSRHQPLYFIATIEDVTEKKKMQEKLLLMAKREEREKSKKAILDYQERLRGLAVRLTLAQEEERRRIASLIHDDIGQNLAFCKLRIAKIRERREIPELDQVLEVLDRSISVGRTLSFELSPTVLYDIGLEEALKSLARLYLARHGLQVTVRDTTRRDVPLPFRILLFQAAREFLANVAKHSQASSAVVSVVTSGRSLRLSVRDDGVGFVPPEEGQPGAYSGFGLFSVKEQLRNAGGVLHLESSPGHGTTVTAVVPLNPPRNRRART